MSVERKYVLTKVAAKDYLLPSNDGETIWRITTYEDGPSHGVEMSRDRRGLALTVFKHKRTGKWIAGRGMVADD